jgi:hypothetical protein
MNEALLKQAGLVEEEVIAVDAIGFRPTNASAYVQTRRSEPLRECCGRQQSNDFVWHWSEFCVLSTLVQVASMSAVSQPG